MLLACTQLLAFATATLTLPADRFLYQIVRLHLRRSSGCAGDPMNALGAAMAQQQFHTVLDSMSYEEVYEYFGGGLLITLRAELH